MIQIVFDGEIYLEVAEQDGTKGKVPIPDQLVRDMLAEWADTTLWKVLESYSAKSLQIRKSPPKRKTKKSTRERK